MNYTRKSFSVGVGSDAYRSGWEAVFRRRDPEPIDPVGELSERALALLTPKERVIVERMRAEPKRKAEIEAMAKDAIDRAKASHERTKGKPRSPLAEAMIKGLGPPTKPLVLANESFDHVAELVANPPPPNTALKRASRRKGSK